ncbi:hypothetical protein PX699_27480 [Sphingobium sp. H39-3-25]|uniref:hypothetical protein n=1 Tax=Sphingobium arseniciresistens TaxID=3030834 RepID=UPI0023B93EE4|nr:hypothetical protein [Sphingobium arseniciresistens]
MSVKTDMRRAMSRLDKARSPAASYVLRHAEGSPMWDQLSFATWIDPAIVTRASSYGIDVNIDHGAGYCDTLVDYRNHPDRSNSLDIEADRFYALFARLMARPSGNWHIR